MRSTNSLRNASSSGPPPARDANASTSCNSPCGSRMRIARTVGVSRDAVGSQRLGNVVSERDIGLGEDDVVFFDDALVEPVDLLVGERERGLDDRLLA